MAAVNFELHPREPKAEQCWIFVDDQLVEKCATVDKDARLAAHGLTIKKLTDRQVYRMESASRGRQGGRIGNRYSGR